MSILGLMGNTADQGQTTPDLSALPSTHGERMGAAWDAGNSPDRFWNVNSARKERADKIIDDLHAMTGERLLNPFDNSPTQAEIRENLGQPTTVIYAKRLEALREARRGRPRPASSSSAACPRTILTSTASTPRSPRRAVPGGRADERLTGTGGGFGGFIGAAGAEMMSPLSILTAFMPVTRMPLAIAEAHDRRICPQRRPRGAVPGRHAGAVQACRPTSTTRRARQFGTEQTTAQIFEEIRRRTVGGAFLGGAFRAAHLGILKLASRGVEIPPAVRDAAVMAEGAELYGTKNPLRGQCGAERGRTLEPGVSATWRWAGQRRPTSMSSCPGLHTRRAGSSPNWRRATTRRSGWRDEARAMLAPEPETIARLKAQADAADAAIAAAGPQTQEGAEQLGQQARLAHELYDDAVARANAQGIGAPIETASPTSMRQQLQAADLELRDLIPEINAVMKRAGDEVTAATRAADAARAEAQGLSPEAGISEARLTPDEVSRVRELQDQIAEYERMRDAAPTPEDEPAWQQAIDDFNGEIAKIMDLDVAEQAPVQAAVKAVAEHPSNPMQAPRMTPETPPAAVARKAPGESPEDKTILQQAQQALDNETLAQIDPGARQKMEQLDIQEREYKTAISCVVGVI